MVSLGELNVTRWNETSFNGYNFSVLKSAIQKYARRNMQASGIWSLIEIDTFGKLEYDSQYIKLISKKYNLEAKTIITKAKTIRTNMVNRLIVMMSEEVSVSCWWLPIVMEKLYKKWMRDRSGDESRKSLIEMYLYITNGKMIRLVSDVNTVYMVSSIENPDTKLLKIHTELLKENNLIVPTDKISDIQLLFKKVKQGIQDEDDKCLYYVKRILEVSGKNKDNIKKLWKIIHKRADYLLTRASLYTFESLEFFYNKMTHREKPIYLYHAILLLLKRSLINWDTKIEELSVNDRQVDCLYNINWSGKKYPIDEDYIYDKHTSHARDRSLKVFVLEGAKVENEDTIFLNPHYRHVYIDYKLRQEGIRTKAPLETFNYERHFAEFYNTFNAINMQILKEQHVRESGGIKDEWPSAINSRGFFYRDMTDEDVSNLKNYIIGQKVTSKSKKVTRLTKKWVYKGPFKYDDLALRLVDRRSHLFKQFGDKAFVPNMILKHRNGEFWLKMPNLGKLPETEQTWYLPGDRETIGKVAIRNDKYVEEGVVRASEEIMVNGDLPEEMWFPLLYHFSLRYILRAGDTGIWNVINGKGIDFEDMRKDYTPTNAIDALFFKKSSKGVMELVKKYVNIYKKDLANRIEENVFSGIPSEEKRKKLLIKLLRK